MNSDIQRKFSTEFLMRVWVNTFLDYFASFLLYKIWYVEYFLYLFNFWKVFLINFSDFLLLLIYTIDLYSDLKYHNFRTREW